MEPVRRQSRFVLIVAAPDDDGGMRLEASNLIGKGDLNSNGDGILVMCCPDTESMISGSRRSPSHLLDDLVSHRLYEVPLGGIHGAGKQEVLPNLETHEPLSVRLSNCAFTHRSHVFERQKRLSRIAFLCPTWSQI